MEKTRLNKFWESTSQKCNCTLKLTKFTYMLINTYLVYLFVLALNSMVQISDRPVTRQGLGGIKTQGQGM